MLAVKLHRQKKPWLGKGSYLIPIASWETGKVQIFNWIRILNTSGKRASSSKFRPPIKFITLIKIPDDHPIALYHDWIESKLRRKDRKEFEFKFLREQSSELKKELKEWSDRDPDLPGPDIEAPELILGQALPSSCIKWTKDIHLLYRGDKRKSKL